tara:strand:+ start:1351 stop:1512 length:162 start_codon:yes stop_codon:yes gene_type:complete
LKGRPEFATHVGEGREYDDAESETAVKSVSAEICEPLDTEGGYEEKGDQWPKF